MSSVASGRSISWAPGWLLIALLASVMLGLVAELRWSDSAEAAGYSSRGYGGYRGSIRHGRGQTRMRTTHHNRHARKSKPRRSGSGRSGYYRHGSVRQPTAFKSSDKYGPPRKYNPYRKRK